MSTTVETGAAIRPFRVDISDEVLDNFTLSWLTNTGVSASRLYWEYKGGFFNVKGSPFQWPSASFRASNTEPRAAPQPTFWRKLETHDDVGWEDR